MNSRRNLLVAMLAALATITGFCQGGRAEVLRNRLLARDTTHVMVVAHRGDWRAFPENSVEAVKHSIEVGVDVVEIDLQLTKDSVLIIMHDATLNRTTNGKGKISDHTAAQIAKLHLKNGAGITGKYHVPTLEEMLLAAKGKVLINLDKADRYFDLVVPILEKTGTTRQIIMKGHRPAAEVKQLYGKYLNDVIYMPIVNLQDSDSEAKIAGHLKDLKPVAFEICYNYDTIVGQAKALRPRFRGKSLLWYNTLWDTLCGGHDDDMAVTDLNGSYGFLIDTLGARIIQTDRAELLLGYLKSRGLHE